jgi:hypothetical protein
MGAVPQQRVRGAIPDDVKQFVWQLTAGAVGSAAGRSSCNTTTSSLWRWAEHRRRRTFNSCAACATAGRAQG